MYSVADKKSYNLSNIMDHNIRNVCPQSDQYEYECKMCYKIRMMIFIIVLFDQRIFGEIKISKGSHHLKKKNHFFLKIIKGGWDQLVLVTLYFSFEDSK